MKRLVIHIGFGKTATTLFQKHLLPKHTEINYLGGVRTSNAESENKILKDLYILLRAIISLDSCEFDEEYWIGFYKKRIYVNLHKKKLNFVSEEWLSSTPVAMVRGDRGLIAGRLCKIFGSQTVILMFIRNQIEVIKSLFRKHKSLILNQFIRNSNIIKMQQLTEDNFNKILFQTCDYGILSKYRYYNITKKYSDLFGDNLLVKVYEGFNQDHDSFLTELSRNLEINPQGFLKNFPAKRINESNSSVGLREIIKGLFFIQPQKCFFDSKDVFSGNYFVLGQTREEDIKGFIERYYKEDNRKLNSFLSIDLEKYGYPI